MNKGKEIVKKDEFEKPTDEVLRSSALFILEGISGMASSKKEEWFLSAGHLLQGLVKGKILDTLNTEWTKWRDKGKIKEDYQKTEQHKDILMDLLKTLDMDTPDEKRMELLKKIFFVSASETEFDRTSLLPVQYMKLAKSLNTGEIIVLFAAYKIGKEQEYKKDSNFAAYEWLKMIADKSQLEFNELVEVYETSLIDKNLISARVYPDKSGVIVNPMFRLTSYGYRFCDYVEHYEELIKDINDKKVE